MNFEKWEVTRSKGKNYFLWVYGVSGWGITTAILWSIFMQLTQPDESFWVRLIIALVIFPALGLLWAHFSWRSTEKKYHEFTSNL